MFKSIYTLFQYNIKKYISDIKYISLYNRQFDNIVGEREIPYPAALIEILPIQTNNLGSFIQQSVVTVRVHVATEVYEGSEFGDSQQNDSLDHLNILDLFHKHLNNIATDDYYLPTGTTESGITYDYGNFYIQSCRRKSTQTVYQTNVLRVSYIDFELFVLDQTAQKQWILLTGGTLEIEPSGVTFYTP